MALTPTEEIITLCDFGHSEGTEIIKIFMEGFRHCKAFIDIILSDPFSIHVVERAVLI